MLQAGHNFFLGLAAKIFGWIVITDATYGADPTGATDSATAIQNALTAAGAISGSGYRGTKVYGPPGNYVCHHKLAIPDGVTFKLAGKRASILRFSYDGTTPASDFVTGCVRLGDGGSVLVMGTRLEDCRIFCSTSAEVGVYTTQANENSGLRNVAIHDFTQYGVQVARQGANDPVADCEIIDNVEMFVTAAPALAGVQIDEAAGVIMINDLSMNMTGSSLAKTPDGIKVVKATGAVLIDGLHVENCTDAVDVGTGVVNDQSGSLRGLHTNNCTNGVHFQNAAGSQRWSVGTIKMAGTFTNAILDDASSIAITAPWVESYAPSTVPALVGSVRAKRRNALRPTNVTAAYESFERQTAVLSGLSVLLSQRVSMFAVDLPAGLKVVSFTFVTGGTPLAGGNHQLAGLYDDVLGRESGTVRGLLRGSTDLTSGAWAATTAKTFTLTSPYTTLTEGLFYVGLLVDAGTVPNLHGLSTGATSIIGQVLTPILMGTSDTAVTALPNPSGVITTAPGLPYFTVNV